MNTVPASQIPDENAPDERTATEALTAGGEGWSEDMELAPSHPGDRTRTRRVTSARASGCRRCSPAPVSPPAASART